MIRLGSDRHSGRRSAFLTRQRRARYEAAGAMVGVFVVLVAVGMGIVLVGSGGLV